MRPTWGIAPLGGGSSRSRGGGHGFDVLQGLRDVSGRLRACAGRRREAPDPVRRCGCRRRLSRGGFCARVGSLLLSLGVVAAVPKVRILADYCSPGYQLACDEARSFGALPVDDALLDRLAGWAGRFEACDPLDFEDVSGSRFDFVAFADEGLEIARAVKRALPHWTVLYWDDGLDWFLARDPRSYRPARSEYEVTLKDAFASRPPSRRSSA